ncbi:helix-turn-helix domain-containing protein [Cryobacterium sp. M15]|uniref:helix-turn-helix domain-containing protein n=1 Tax=Cryobacterium sp. M15 TaxID=2048291 RepID=UPI000CE3ABC0
MAFFTARASGTSLRKSAALAGISRSTACLWLKQSGGVRPRATKPQPALRLTLDDRESISRGLAASRSLTAIAAELRRPVSTVSRECSAIVARADTVRLPPNVSPWPAPGVRDWKN